MASSPPSSPPTDDPSASTERTIESLEKRLYRNPMQYDAHLEYISALVNSGAHVEKIRHARDRFATHYPLTQDLWLAWLHDEMGAEEVDRAFVQDLFERATADYLNPKVWHEYIAFMCNGADIDAARATLQKAISALGNHFVEGPVVWQAHVRYEQGIMEALNQAGAEQDTYEDQIENVIQAYKAWLSIPLLNMQAAMDEFEAWTSSIGIEVDESIDDAFDEAQERQEKYDELEGKLAQAPSPRREAYAEYIAYEKAESTPDRVQLAYERALMEDALNTALWTEYAEYVSETLSAVRTVVLSVHARAVRNCTWYVPLWQAYMLAAERVGQAVDDIKAISERALQAGFASAEDYLEIWSSVCELQFRAIKLGSAVAAADLTEEQRELVEAWRNITDQAITYMTEYFPPQGDVEGRLSFYRARMEARWLRNMDGAREAIERFVKTADASSVSLWLVYAAFEREHGTAATARSVFKRGLDRVREGVEALAQAYVRFEREEGTVESIQHAHVRIGKRLAVLGQREAERVQRETAAAQAEQEARAAKRDKAKKDKEAKGERKGKGAKADGAKGDSGKPALAPEAHVEATMDVSADSNAGKGRKRGSDEDARDYTAPSSPRDLKRARMAEEGADAAGSPGGEQHGHGEEDVSRTIFVKNLSFAVTKEELQEVLEKLGLTVKTIRIPILNGRSKGFAYVELASADEVELALTKDRTMIKDRPMFINKCTPKGVAPSAPRPALASRADPKSLFVKNLAFMVTEDDLRQLFSQHGKLHAVRLGVTPEGKPRGFAHIEFEDSADASRALLATDKCLLKGRLINVAISNPPPAASSVAANAARAPGPSGSALTQLANAEVPKAPNVTATAGFLAPRQAAKAQPVLGGMKKTGGRLALGKGTGDSADTSQSQSAQAFAAADGKATEEAPLPAKKSNADFRAMLLGGKT